MDLRRRPGAEVSAALKIAIVLGPFQPLPPAGFGAVEKVWHDLAHAFASAGHEVLLAGKTGKAGHGQTTERAGLRVLPLDGYEASASLYRNLALDFLYSLEVGRRLGGADVIVTNSFWMPLVLALFARNCGKIVVHVARFPKRQMWLYRGAHVLQAISSAVAAEIIRQEPSMRAKVRVLPYPVDVGIFTPPAVARTYGGELTVLYVGRLHPEKGLDLLVRAFRTVKANVPQSRLKLVGPSSIAQGGGGADWLATLKDCARGLPVEFAGPIAEPSRLAIELQHAHCFCYPSLAENGEAFGLSVLEAMATGLPVVVSDLGCFGDFVEDGREGLVFDHRATGSEAALAACLVRLLSDPSTASRLGENAAEKAKGYRLDKVAERYMSMFEEVAGS